MDEACAGLDGDGAVDDDDGHDLRSSENACSQNACSENAPLVVGAVFSERCVLGELCSSTRNQAVLERVCFGRAVFWKTLGPCSGKRTLCSRMRNQFVFSERVSFGRAVFPVRPPFP
jgi:hypothetical protein